MNKGLLSGVIISFILVISLFSVFALNWSRFHNDLGNSGYQNETISLSNFGLVWVHPNVKVDLSSPAVSNGIIYFGSGLGVNGTLYALNAANGSIIWNYPLGDIIESSPEVSGGIVYFGGLTENFMH